jgi:hypothetical protein
MAIASLEQRGRTGSRFINKEPLDAQKNAAWRPPVQLWVAVEAARQEMCFGDPLVGAFSILLLQDYRH